jgi:hypothetical protein
VHFLGFIAHIQPYNILQSLNCHKNLFPHPLSSFYKLRKLSNSYGDKLDHYLSFLFFLLKGIIIAKNKLKTLLIESINIES